MNYFLLLFDLHNLEDFELIMAVIVIFFILLALIDIGGFSKTDEKLKLRGIGLGLGGLGTILLIAYFTLPYIIAGLIVIIIVLIFGGLGYR